MEEIKDLYPIGTVVRLLPGKYPVTESNPIDIDGVVTSHAGTFTPVYRVMWSNSLENVYRPSDLTLTFESKFKVTDLVFYKDKTYRVQNMNLSEDKSKVFYDLKDLEIDGSELYDILEDDIRLLTKEEIENIVPYDELKNIRKSILEILEEDKFEIEGSIDKYTLIIHYPLIKMVNVKGDSHDIHDMFVKIEVKNDNVVSIQGVRSTFSGIEYKSYVHNYISGWSTNFNGFCLGNSNLRDYYSVNKITENTIVSFLHELEGYLSFGGERNPHMKFSGLSSNNYKDHIYIDNININNVLNTILSKIDIDKLKLIVSSTSCKVTLNDYLYSLIDDNTNIKGYVDEKGDCYKDYNSLSIEIPDTKVITFNDKDFYLKIFQEEKKDIKKEVAPELLKGIINELNSKIKYKIKHDKQYKVRTRTKRRVFRPI